MFDIKKSRLRTNSIVITTALCFGLTMTGCAAKMAASGQRGPDMTEVMQEATRLDVERHLGNPIEINSISNGHTLALYNVESRTEPSLLRAAGHGTLDLLTYGLWEAIAGLGELYLGRRVDVTVEYDNENKMVKLERI